MAACDECRDYVVSYCIATYKRPGLLKNTLGTILQQDDFAIEIIVSDNDPEGSAADVVAKLNSPKIRYYKNQENLGMIRNFNSALSKACGEYVVMIADDDPVEPNHIKTLRELAKQYPGYGAYYGVGVSFTFDKTLARLWNIPVGKPNQKGTGKTTAYSGDQFVQLFFEEKIRRYLLWSCGMVRREIAQRIKMPDYGSPYLTDFAYVALVSKTSGIVITDQVLGMQEIHQQNFGREQYRQLEAAVGGFCAFIDAAWPCNGVVRKSARTFCGNWVAAHLAFLIRYSSGVKEKLTVLTYSFQLHVLDEKFGNVPFKTINYYLRRGRVWALLRQGRNAFRLGWIFISTKCSRRNYIPRKI